MWPSAMALSPTANATVDAIACLRNGLSRVIVSLEGAPEDCGVQGLYRRTLYIIGTALTSGIDDKRLIKRRGVGYA